MLLEVQKINTYYDKSHIIKDVSLKVDRGEVVGIIGRNGVGKTTILRTIMGLSSARSGTVHFNGKSLQGLSPFERARLGVGFVFEDRRIFSALSVRDNLEIGSIPRGDRHRRWSYERILEVFPLLVDLQDRKGMNLSGGQQQMLAIARTLMGNPTMLILDEPTEGLAPLVVTELLRLLKEIRNEVTILITEQNLKFVLDLVDRAYIVEKGKIQYEGAAVDLMASKETQDKYLGVGA